MKENIVFGEKKKETETEGWRERQREKVGSQYLGDADKKRAWSRRDEREKQKKGRTRRRRKEKCSSGSAPLALENSGTVVGLVLYRMTVSYTHLTLPTILLV